MASKKKGKKRRKRVIDSGGGLEEAPGSGIEPGQALDEAESIEETAKSKKAAKAPEADKKIEKAARKPPTKRPGIFATLKKFLKDVHAEAKKVVWPDSEQLKNSTTVVVVTILALAAFMGFFSKVFYQFSDLIFMPETEMTAPAEPTGPGYEGVPEEGGGAEGGGDPGGGAPVGAEDTS